MRPSTYRGGMGVLRRQYSLQLRPSVALGLVERRHARMEEHVGQAAPRLPTKPYIPHRTGLWGGWRCDNNNNLRPWRAVGRNRGVGRQTTRMPSHQVARPA